MEERTIAIPSGFALSITPPSLRKFTPENNCFGVFSIEIPEFPLILIGRTIL
jgi:hypothetical protein